jgi:hypothetical protein
MLRSQEVRAHAVMRYAHVACNYGVQWNEIFGVWICEECSWRALHLLNRGNIHRIYVGEMTWWELLTPLIRKTYCLRIVEIARVSFGRQGVSMDIGWERENRQVMGYLRVGGEGLLVASWREFPSGRLQPFHFNESLPSFGSSWNRQLLWHEP